MNYTQHNRREQKPSPWALTQLARPLVALLLALFMTGTGLVSAQCPCTTTSLNINTGLNPITGAQIPGAPNKSTTNDPCWIVTKKLVGGTMIPGVTRVAAGSSANIIQNWGWPTVTAGYINGFNANTFISFPFTSYEMGFKRTFNLCKADVITVNIVWIYGDNWIRNLKVDGAFLTPSGANISGLNSYSYTAYMGPGTHEITVDLIPKSHVGTNPTGLMVQGFVSSPGSAIETQGLIQPIAVVGGGPATVCQGGTLALSDATPGGSWAISPASPNATVSSTGVVTGILPGTVTVVYSVGSMPCPVKRVVTIVPIPVVGTLTGVRKCQFSVFTLPFSGTTTPGGTWTSINTSVATVNATTGQITAVGFGTSTIKYTIGASGPCPPVVATAVVSIDPAPAFSLPTLPLDVCSGSGYTLCASPATITTGCAGGCSYAWSWGPTSYPCAAHGPVSNLSCFPTGLNNTLTVTNNVTHCSASRSRPVSIWKQTIAGTINGTPSVCAGQTYNYTVTGNSCPGTWTVIAPSGLGITPLISVSPTLSLYAGNPSFVTVPTPIVIKYTVSNPGCGTVVATYNVMVNPIPTASASLVGTCNPICPGSPVNIKICGTPGAVVGATWLDPGGISSSMLITLPSLSGPGGVACTTISVVATTEGMASFDLVNVTNQLTGCSRSLRSGLKIKIAYPKCNLAVHGSGPICIGSPFQIEISGDPGVYHISQAWGPSFIVTVPPFTTVLSPWLWLGSATGMNTFCVTQIDGCSCTVYPTEARPLCCLSVGGAMPPPVTLTGPPVVCIGSPFTLTANVGTGGGAVSSLVWKRPPSGTVFGTTTTVAFGPNTMTAPPPGFGVYSVVATAATGCTTTATVNIIPGASPYVSLSSMATLCQGVVNSVPITISGTPGTTGTYNIAPMGITGTFPAIPASGSLVITVPILPTTTAPVTITITTIANPLYCVSGPGPFATLGMVVNPAPTVTMTVGGETCAGDHLTFTGTAGSTVTYTIAGVTQPALVMTGSAVVVPITPTGTTTYAVTDVVSTAGCHMPGPLPVITAGPTPPLDACVSIGPAYPGAGYNVFWITGTPGAVVAFDHWTWNTCTSVGGTTPGGTVTLTGGTATLPISYADVCPLIYRSMVYLTTISYTTADGVTCTLPLSCTSGLKPAGGHATTEIAELLAGFSPLVVAPNPNKGSFLIEGSFGEASCDVTIEITDMTGRLVHSDKTSMDKGKLKKTISLANSVANGVYFVRVKGESLNQVVRFTIDR